MKKRDDVNCEEVSKTKLIHCGLSKVCTCPVKTHDLTVTSDHDEQVISLCGMHHEVKNAFLSLDFVAKRMENRENHNKVSFLNLFIQIQNESTIDQVLFLT